MLVDSSYDEAAGKDAHEDRADVTANEISGTGYTSGGANTTVTVTADDANDRVDIDFSDVSFTNATITAAGGIIYKSTGTAATDTVIAFLDFGGDVSSTNGTFTVSVTSPLRFQN